MHSMSHMTVLPGWLRAVLAVVLFGVFVVHLWHSATMPGQRRWWHVGHTLMAAGMALMYAVPMMTVPTLRDGMAVVFAAMTVVSTGTALLLRRREGVLNPLWTASALDMLAMTYMLLPHSARIGVVTTVFVLYLAVQTVAWAFGLWDRAPALRPAADRTSHAPALDTPGATVLDVPPEQPGRDSSDGGPLGLTAHSTPAVRVSLGAMAASMAVMLVAM